MSYKDFTGLFFWVKIYNKTQFDIFNSLCMVRVSYPYTDKLFSLYIPTCITAIIIGKFFKTIYQFVKINTT